jgi:N-acetyltransferase 10
MLHLLDNSYSSMESNTDQAKKGSWLAEFWADFRRRFISLLGFQFRSFTPALALSVLQNKACKQEPTG